MFSKKIKSIGTVTIDLDKLTVADVRALTDKKAKDQNGDEVIARVSGLTVEQLVNMSYPDYRRLTRFFWSCVADPLKDEDEEKNSQSASTSE